MKEQEKNSRLKSIKLKSNHSMNKTKNLEKNNYQLKAGNSQRVGKMILKKSLIISKKLIKKTKRKKLQKQIKVKIKLKKVKADKRLRTKLKKIKN